MRKYRKAYYTHTVKDESTNAKDESTNAKDESTNARVLVVFHSVQSRD